MNAEELRKRAQAAARELFLLDGDASKLAQKVNKLARRIGYLYKKADDLADKESNNDDNR